MTGAQFYPAYKKEWNGRRVDVDRIYAFQCVDLITQFCHELGVNGVSGNAIDYANRPSPNFVAHFSRAHDYQQGDVVVLYGLAGNPYGHIGLFDHKDGSGIWLFEQNATGSANGLGKSAIGVWRAVPTSRVAAIWRYKGTAPPKPKPVPARATVFLPSSNRTWTLYYVGSGLRPRTSDVKAVLSPASYPPGLTYKIVSRVGDYAVVIDTQYFGRGTVWTKGTNAVIK